MQKEKKDLITGSVLAVISVVYFCLSFQIRQTSLISITSSFLPQLCAICLFALSACMIVRGSRKLLTAKGSREVSEEQRTEGRSRMLAAITAFVVLAIGIVLMDNMGFVCGMAFYLFASFVCFSKFEKKNWLLFAILAIVVPVIVYLVFTKAFYLRLPAGIFDIGGGIL